jgi:hypothetical protein
LGAHLGTNRFKPQQGRRDLALLDPLGLQHHRHHVGDTALVGQVHGCATYVSPVDGDESFDLQDAHGLTHRWQANAELLEDLLLRRETFAACDSAAEDPIAQGFRDELTYSGRSHIRLLVPLSTGTLT